MTKLTLIVDVLTAFYMAVGGRRPVTEEKNYTLTTPSVTIGNNTCLNFDLFLVWKDLAAVAGVTFRLNSTAASGEILPLAKVGRNKKKVQTQPKLTLAQHNLLTFSAHLC